MTDSLPSKRIAYTDVPEVKNFDASFVYGFFTPDERTNDSGVTSAEFIKTRSAGKFDNVFIDTINFRRFTPRFVRFSWSPTVDENRLKKVANPNISSINIKSNFQKIHNEQTFTTDDFTNTYLQDSGAGEKIDFFVRRALDEIRHRQSNEEESPLDVLRFLQENTGKQVSEQFLTDTFLNLSKNGHTFLDKQGFEKIANTVIEEITKVRVRTQINNKVIGSILKTTQENTINIFDTDAEDLLKSADQIQEQAISHKNSSILDGRDYDFEVLEFIDYHIIDPNSFEPVVQVIGYIIDKHEILENGGTLSHEPIIVENPLANSAVDLRVRYGTTYVYTVRSIAYVQLQAEDTETNSVIALGFLISSKPTNNVLVNTEETIPPPPPADFKADWCYTKNAARLFWNFPVNPQRDIKKFQIFRRSSILEPFQLIKEFNFDNSQILSQERETPDPQNVIKMASPQTYYIDYEFTKNSKFIYAICAIDAHGFTSGYSTQFEISFNRFKNKIEKRLISLSGAPKAYPNAFLQEDTFVDTIKDSGHQKVKIYFNPEYLSITDAKHNDLRLLKFGEDSEYRLQMINVDLQQQQIVKINLQDKRTGDKKPK